MHSAGLDKEQSPCASFPRLCWSHVDFVDPIMAYACCFGATYGPHKHGPYKQSLLDNARLGVRPSLHHIALLWHGKAGLCERHQGPTAIDRGHKEAKKRRLTASDPASYCAQHCAQQQHNTGISTEHTGHCTTHILRSGCHDIDSRTIVH